MIPSRKKKYYKIYDSYFIAVCLGVTSLSHTSEEGKIYWNIKRKSAVSFLCSKILSYSYSKIKDVIQAILSFFGLVTASYFFR